MQVLPSLAIIIPNLHVYMCLCEMHRKTECKTEYLRSKQRQKFQPEKVFIVKMFCQLPKKMKIFYQNFSHNSFQW